MRLGAFAGDFLFLADEVNESMSLITCSGSDLRPLRVGKRFARVDAFGSATASNVATLTLSIDPILFKVLPLSTFYPAAQAALSADALVPTAEISDFSDHFEALESLDCLDPALPVEI